MSEDKVRCFIAVELSAEAKAEVQRLTKAVSELEIRGVRAVRPEGVHVTLRFLGDIESDAVPRAIAAIRASASQSRPFDLSLAEVGAFPNNRSARVLWAGASGDTDDLEELHERVESELAAVGFRRDRRRFNPHITLARLRERVSGSDRRRVVEKVSTVGHARVAFRVDAITLFQSTLHPEGSIHTPLCRVRFVD